MELKLPSPISLCGSNPESAMQHSGERTPLACWFSHSAKTNFRAVPKPVFTSRTDSTTSASSSRWQNANARTLQACAPRIDHSLGFHLKNIIIACTVLLVTQATAQETPTATAAQTPAPIATVTPSPTPTAFPTTRTIQLRFVPPPVDGKISLGIYDASGKLVRVLHREAETEEFTEGHDALITEWDGKDENGADLPPGKYSARGYLVGALSVEGIDYFFNDWVTDDDSPHLKKIERLSYDGKDLHLIGEGPAGEKIAAVFDLTAKSLRAASDPAPAPAEPTPPEAPRAESVIELVDAARGKDNTFWIIDHVAKDTPALEVKQLSAEGKILRHLAYQPNDPPPKAIAASTIDDRIFVLEENAALQQVRELSLLGTQTGSTEQPAISDWKVEFEEAITAHPNFAIENATLVAAPTATPPAPAKISQQLKPNALQHDERGKVELTVGFDADGSYLQTADGLPLCTISDSPHLIRALARTKSANSIDVFQDDGAVVEQYRISNTDQLFAFDCGDFELK